MVILKGHLEPRYRINSYIIGVFFNIFIGKICLMKLSVHCPFTSWQVSLKYKRVSFFPFQFLFGLSILPTWILKWCRLCNLLQEVFFLIPTTKSANDKSNQFNHLTQSYMYNDRIYKFPFIWFIFKDCFKNQWFKVQSQIFTEKSTTNICCSYYFCQLEFFQSLHNYV